MSTVDPSDRDDACGSVVAEERLRPLSRDELERYHRNALVPQVGVVGQQRIRASRVLLVGAGGLGAPPWGVPRWTRRPRRSGLSTPTSRSSPTELG